MEPLSRSERAALCNTALEVGPDAPTLCGDWTVKDLVIHLVVRERDPLGAPGIAIKPLAGLTERASRRLVDHDFTALVERVRQGPPKWSPFALSPVDAAVNGMEFLIHHEDIRRASPGWTTRELGESEQKAIWRGLGGAGKMLVRPARVPVEVRWLDGPGEKERCHTLRRGKAPAIVTGQPAELALFLFGRDEHQGLEYAGPPASIDALKGSDKGL